MQFRSLQWLPAERLSDGVYAELIDELFAAAPSVVVVAISQSVIGSAIFLHTGDLTVLGLTIAIVLISIERIVMMRRYRHAASDKPLSRADITLWERRYVSRSIASALVISAIGVRCFMLADPTIHMLAVGMLSTYCAGTLMRVAHRPRLAIVNLLIISIPTPVAGIIHGGPIYLSLALMTGILLVGAFDVIRHSYNTTVSQITLKRQFAGLARQDALTGLSNRLELNERLELAIGDAQRNGCGLAVHSLDLDRFKAANDLYGHPAGDAILKQVAQRLSRLTRASDILVRLGGDEFVLVQTGVATREQATSLGLRIVEDICSHYNINGYTIELGTSVGIALLMDERITPDDLLARADQALYHAKRTRSGYAVYTVAPHLVPSLNDGDDFQDHNAISRKTVNLR